eukprot:m.124994 g.124994  ORF g.124994 m.124994 type:complete len:398 (+) comp19768_c0_seq1:512-1705(+)
MSANRVLSSRPKAAAREGSRLESRGKAGMCLPKSQPPQRTNPKAAASRLPRAAPTAQLALSARLWLPHHPQQQRQQQQQSQLKTGGAVLRRSGVTMRYALPGEGASVRMSAARVSGVVPEHLFEYVNPVHAGAAPGAVRAFLAAEGGAALPPAPWDFEEAEALHGASVLALVRSDEPLYAQGDDMGATANYDDVHFTPMEEEEEEIYALANHDGDDDTTSGYMLADAALSTEDIYSLANNDAYTEVELDDGEAGGPISVPLRRARAAPRTAQAVRDRNSELLYDLGYNLEQAGEDRDCEEGVYDVGLGYITRASVVETVRVKPTRAQPSILPEPGSLQEAALFLKEQHRRSRMDGGYCRLRAEPEGEEDKEAPAQGDSADPRQRRRQVQSVLFSEDE